MRFQSLRLVAVLAGTLFLTKAASAQNPFPKNLKARDLFGLTNVWTAHLQFSPEQWREIEPAGGESYYGGGRGGREWVSPANIVATGFLQEGDVTKDRRLSKTEFRALAERWFRAWDTKKTGAIRREQFRVGFGEVFAPIRNRMDRSRLQADEGFRNGVSGSRGVDFKYVHATLDIGSRRFEDVGVRYKGNGTYMRSRNSQKRSLKVDLNKYVKGQKLSGVATLNFHSNVTDPGWMNEVLSHRLYRDAGVPAPRTAYARVYVTAPGTYQREYFGLYSLVENVDVAFAEERWGTKSGAIFKPSTRVLFEYLGPDWDWYNQIYDPKTELTAEQKGRVIDFSRLVTQATDLEFAAVVGDLLDLDEFARFMAITTWLSTLDSILGIGQNYLIYLHPETKKFQFIPWDLDGSFGKSGMSGTQEQRENLSIHRPWNGGSRFLERVYRVDAFKKIYLERLAEFSKTILRPERLSRQVDELAAYLRPAIKEEGFESLSRFERVISGELMDNGWSGRQPAKPIKGFVVARAASVHAQLENKSEGEVLERSFGGRGGLMGRSFAGLGEFGVGDGLVTYFEMALDSDKNGEVTMKEFVDGFDRWFASWDNANQNSLSEDQLRSAVETNFFKN